MWCPGGVSGWGVLVGRSDGAFGWGVREGCSGGVFGWGVRVGCSGGVFGWGARVGCSSGVFGFGWGVRVECTHRKDKISGWVGGPVCSCKNEKQTAHCKGSNLQLITYGQDRQCCCPRNRKPPSELQYSVQGFKRAVVRRADKCSNKSKHRTNRHCIPHADQAANLYTSECQDQRKRQANLGRN